jgi:hypothetical protein
MAAGSVEYSLDQEMVKKLCFDIAFHKKIVIYGINAHSFALFQTLKRNGRDVIYFVEDVSSEPYAEGKPVLSVHDLRFEDLRDVYVAVVKAPTAKSSYIFRLLTDIGMRFQLDFDDFLRRKRYAAGIFPDVHLGTNVLGELPGFAVYGDLDRRHALRIATLGGSVTDSVHTCAMEFTVSWPELLYRRMSALGHDAVVLNGGVSGHNSYQEAQKFIRDVIHLRPDLVISYSGSNDVTNLPEHSQRLNRWRRPYLSEVSERFYRTNSGKSTSSGHGSGLVIYGIQYDISPAEGWLNNMRLMNCLAGEFSFRFLAILQPNVSTHKNQGIAWPWEIEPVERTFINHRAQYDAFYAAVRERLPQYPYILDYADLFGEKHYYHSVSHVSTAGNDLIAGRIFGDLAARGLL